MSKRALFILITAGALLTCLPIKSAWSSSPDEEMLLKADLDRCIGQPCEKEMLLKYGIVSVRTDAGRMVIDAGVICEVRHLCP